MRKKLLSALTAAFILGAVSPTYAMEINEDFTVDLEARYEFSKEKGSSASNRLEARILPTYRINDQYSIKARFTGWFEFDPSDSSGRMNWLYGQGDFDQFTVKVGKVDFISHADATPLNDSMVIDSELKGVTFETNLEDSNIQYVANIGQEASFKKTYFGVEALYTDESELINAGVGYHYIKTDGKKQNVLAVGGGYKLDEDSSLHAALAYNTSAKSKKSAFNLEYDYKNADPQEVNTWGAYVAYRYLGAGSIKPSYDSAVKNSKSKNDIDDFDIDDFDIDDFDIDDFDIDDFDIDGLGSKSKGFEIGGVWTPWLNTNVKVAYFHGKFLDGGTNNSLYARASWFF